MAKTRKTPKKQRRSRIAGIPPQSPASPLGTTGSGGTPKIRTCGTMPVHERLLRTVPAYRAARIGSENHAFGFANRTLSGARTGVTVIPVVVHVVYNTAVQNISDAQIQSQITILNHDYRKANADVSKTPSVFASLCGDARIEFALATKNPGGNPTNGITRTHTSSTSFIDDDKVKSSSTGGADAWPAADYLNLWACPLGNSLLGYAQFPGGPAATDGVVILHSAFGNIGTAAAPFNLGRTATHEIGHWLNLRHVWGDDGGGCNGDDFIADTPNCSDHNFGKPTFPHVTCNNGPNGDLFMNYMDYTDDDSMFMFTNGQIVRMQACLDGDRSTIGHTKSGPTLTVSDVTTLAVSDFPTVAASDFATIASSDQPTVAVLDHPTVASVDFATIASADHPPTLARLDHPTLASADLATLVRADIGGLPTVATQDVAGPVHTGPGGDPGPIVGGAGRHLPFVLATPHHTMAWQRSFPDLAQQHLQELSNQISYYEQLLAQYTAAEASGPLSSVDSVRAEQITAEYNALVAEYRQLTGA